jgi:hypothetical protein
MKKEDVKARKIKKTEHTELRKAINVVKNGEFVLSLYVAGKFLPIQRGSRRFEKDL